MGVFYAAGQETAGVYKEKGSKFLSFAYPVETEEDIKRHVDRLRSEYHDARHHCYAYVLGLKNQEYRSYDDGEPSHSAGDPILGQIRSFGLTNTLVVVVRYFGGIKLGVGGLVNAYRSAAWEALSQVTKTEVWEQHTFMVQFGYEQTSQVEKVLNSYEIRYIDRKFAEACHYTCVIREEVAEEVLRLLGMIKGVKAYLS